MLAPLRGNLVNQLTWLLLYLDEENKDYEPHVGNEFSHCHRRKYFLLHKLSLLGKELDNNI